MTRSTRNGIIRSRRETEFEAVIYAYRLNKAPVASRLFENAIPHKLNGDRCSATIWTGMSGDQDWNRQPRYSYRHMMAKGKLRQVVVTAIARELAGFVWSIACITTDPPAKNVTITMVLEEVGPPVSTGRSRAPHRQPRKAVGVGGTPRTTPAAAAEASLTG